MILHFSQIFFTDGLTFIVIYQPFLLFASPCDSAFGEVINLYLYFNLITWEYPNIVHSKFPRNVCSHYVTVGEFYLEVRIGQCLKYDAFKFHYIILWQNNPSVLSYHQ